MLERYSASKCQKKILNHVKLLQTLPKLQGGRSIACHSCRPRTARHITQAFPQHTLQHTHSRCYNQALEVERH